MCWLPLTTGSNTPRNLKRNKTLHDLLALMFQFFLDRDVKFVGFALIAFLIMHIVFNQDSWYAPLPVANEDDYYPIKPVLRGAGIKNGFRSAQ